MWDKRSISAERRVCVTDTPSATWSPRDWLAWPVPSGDPRAARMTIAARSRPHPVEPPPGALRQAERVLSAVGRPSAFSGSAPTDGPEMPCAPALRGGASPACARGRPGHGRPPLLPGPAAGQNDRAPRHIADGPPRRGPPATGRGHAAALPEARPWRGGPGGGPHRGGPVPPVGRRPTWSSSTTAAGRVRRSGDARQPKEVLCKTAKPTDEQGARADAGYRLVRPIGFRASRGMSFRNGCHRGCGHQAA